MEIKILVKNGKPDLHCGADVCEKSDIWELVELSEHTKGMGLRLLSPSKRRLAGSDVALKCVLCEENALVVMVTLGLLNLCLTVPSDYLVPLNVFLEPFEHAHCKVWVMVICGYI